ncbi:hypothetical protein FGO68_gene625 [Halteria grandinella]|uniref:Uncharacterized protein n=1 Tax=Halteria grandinella TaxID=5974 RepID=A0A8J8NPC2_HALGN|nr:hypothetical protein FGO68_gene625 [Halteria grandinella]
MTCMLILLCLCIIILSFIMVEFKMAYNGYKEFFSDLSAYITSFTQSLKLMQQQESTVAQFRQQKHLQDSLIIFIESLLTRADRAGMREQVTELLESLNLVPAPSIQSKPQIPHKKVDLAVDNSQQYLKEIQDLKKSNTSLSKSCEYYSKKQKAQQAEIKANEQEIKRLKEEKLGEKFQIKTLQADLLEKTEELKKQVGNELVIEQNKTLLERVDKQTKIIDDLNSKSKVKDEELKKAREELRLAKLELEIEKDSNSHIKRVYSVIQSQMLLLQSQIAQQTPIETTQVILKQQTNLFGTAQPQGVPLPKVTQPQEQIETQIDTVKPMFIVSAGNQLQASFERLRQELKITSMQGFKLHRYFKKDEFKGYHQLKEAKQQIFILIDPTHPQLIQGELKFKFVGIFLDHAVFDWKQFSIFQHHPQFKLIKAVQTPDQGRFQLVLCDQVEVRFNGREYEVEVQERGKIDTCIKFDFSKPFGIFQLL